MRIKIVVRYADGRVEKGSTEDFSPNKDFFHMTEKDTAKVITVSVRDLKAIFFVKTFEGNRDYHENYDVVKTGLGRRIRVEFRDGEKLVGYTQGFSPDRLGFILFTSDTNSNNDRIFVVMSATSKVEFI